MPIIDQQRRVAEIGRIRLGVEVPYGQDKTRPKALNAFRFTSQTREALDAIASAYGGTVEEWLPDGGVPQWQVLTPAREIDVLVMPADLGFSQWYELWKAGGCERRCDGEREIAGNHPRACVCEAEHERRCEMVTRLTVLLPPPVTQTFGGWRLETNSYYAAGEIRSAMEMALAIAQRRGQNFASATLRVEERVVRRPGQDVKRFTVPVLDIAIDPAAVIGPHVETPTSTALASAAALTVASPPETPSRALPRGEAAPAPERLPDSLGEPPVAPQPAQRAAHPSVAGFVPVEGPVEAIAETERARTTRRIFARMADRWPGLDKDQLNDRRHAVAVMETAYRRNELIASFADLTDEELTHVEQRLEDIYRGAVTITAIPYGYRFVSLASGRTADVTEREGKWSYQTYDKEPENNGTSF